MLITTFHQVQMTATEYWSNYWQINQSNSKYILQAWQISCSGIAYTLQIHQMVHSQTEHILVLTIRHCLAPWDKSKLITVITPYNQEKVGVNWVMAVLTSTYFYHQLTACTLKFRFCAFSFPHLCIMDGWTVGYTNLKQHIHIYMYSTYVMSHSHGILIIKPSFILSLNFY